MKNTRHLVIDKVSYLEQEILQTPSETTNPRKALAITYQMLTDEQKIAFILAGGAPSLFQWQQGNRSK